MIEMRKELALEDIRIDQRLQVRAGAELDIAYVEHLMLNLSDLPPIKVMHVREGQTGYYVLVGGFHRYEAVFRKGQTKTLCLIREGTWQDAVLWALGENQDNGKQRQPVDIKHAAVLAFEERKRCGWATTDVEIARAIGGGVDRSYVSKLRREWEEDGARPMSAQNESKNGKSSAASNGGGDDADEDAPFVADPPDFGRAEREAEEIREKIEKESEEERPEHREGCREVAFRAIEDASRMLMVLGLWDRRRAKMMKDLWRTVRGKKRTPVRTP